MIDTNIIGVITELKCKTYFLELGYTVSIPENPARYDFILDTGDKLLKVQVKTCNSDGEKLNFATCSSHFVNGKVTHTDYKADNIDYFCTWFENECYLINKEWIIKDYPKNETSIRQIPIPKSIAEIIFNQGYVYQGHPNSISKFIDKFCKKNDIEHFSIHKLRHYFATVMSTLIPEKDWLYLGGWSTDHIAKTVYQHNQIAKNTEQKKKASEDLMKKIAEYEATTKELAEELAKSYLPSQL